jgi:diadenylate cyclase
VSAIEQLRLLQFGWRDALEIGVIAFVIYRVLLLVQGTRAVQMLIGIIVLVIGYAVAWLAKLTVITWLLGLVFTYGAFAAVIVFQPEIRQALALLGQSRVTRFFRSLQASEVADEIVTAVDRLCRSGYGAIIAVEREVPLGDYVQSGSELQAKVSADLLTTVFTPYSPLHDGAVIVRGDTIVGAGCILPLSQAPIADRSIGTRHRAALGLSEETDALVIVVSEETSSISVASRGELTRHLATGQLRELLQGKPLSAAAEDGALELRA